MAEANRFNKEVIRLTVLDSLSITVAGIALIANLSGVLPKLLKDRPDLIAVDSIVTIASIISSIVFTKALNKVILESALASRD